MTSPEAPNTNPRHSYPGPQMSSAARPRRAYTPEEVQPIMSGYTYEPGRTPPPPLPTPMPTGPLVPPEPPTDSINNYKPRKHTVWIVVIAVVVVVGIVLGIVLSLQPQSSQSTASSTPSGSVYTPQPRTGGQAFSDSSVSGYWKITNTQWTATGVQIGLEINVDTGNLYYQFYAFDSNGQILYPTNSGSSDLAPGFVSAGQTITGTVTLTTTRQTLTLIMSDGQETQLSALPVS